MLACPEHAGLTLASVLTDPRAADPDHLSPFSVGAQRLGYQHIGGKMDGAQCMQCHDTCHPVPYSRNLDCAHLLSLYIFRSFCSAPPGFVPYSGALWCMQILPSSWPMLCRPPSCEAAPA